MKPCRACNLPNHELHQLFFSLKLAHHRQPVTVRKGADIEGTPVTVRKGTDTEGTHFQLYLLRQTPVTEVSHIQGEGNGREPWPRRRTPKYWWADYKTVQAHSSPSPHNLSGTSAPPWEFPPVRQVADCGVGWPWNFLKTGVNGHSELRVWPMSSKRLEMQVYWYVRTHNDMLNT